MRNIVSTALVALIVGGLAGASAGAIAQTPAEVGYSTAASGNADRVDGRHAVGAGATKSKRANKLVATNKNGLLPANIIKRSWGSISGKPSGFSDGIDNVGVAALKVTRVENTTSVSPGSFAININCPANSFVVGGGFDNPLTTLTILRTFPWDRDTWRLYGINGHNNNVTLRGYATCLSTTPSGAISGSANY